MVLCKEEDCPDPSCTHGIPDWLIFRRKGKLGKNTYAVTITQNVKHKDYKKIDDPEIFTAALDDFCSAAGVKHALTGIYEFHKFDGHLRHGGLHLHGVYEYNNPPRNNKNNYFHFHMARIHPFMMEGWLYYMKKSVKQTINILEDEEEKANYMLQNRKDAHIRMCPCDIIPNLHL